MRNAFLRLASTLLVLVAAPACSGDPPPADPDGGSSPMDAGGEVDAPPAPVDSGGPMPECDGFPSTCTSRSTTDCDAVMGCRVSTCGGVAVACSAYVTETECGAAEGCTFGSSGCTGTARSCETYDDEAGCRAQQGCAHSATASCRGSAVRCETLDLATCASQPGCRPRLDAGPPRPDAQVPDAPSLWDGGGVCVPPEPLPIGGCDPATGIECDGDWRGINARTGEEYCAGCAADRCCAPIGGTFRCVDRDAAGACPAPDLFIDAERIEGDYTIEYRDFAAGDCAIVEGCVAGPGRRRLLRFDTWTPNVGTADMFLGVPSAGPYFERSTCHGHFHFNSYAEYELLTPDGMCVAATGHKQAFCLLDFYRYPGTDGTGAVYNCGYQGIQQNWQDVYGAGLDCQWVDVTDVPPGDYLLRIRVNVENVLNETNYDNNEITVPVTITGGGTAGVMIDEPCTGGIAGASRDCGWSRAHDGTCTPGEMVTVGCSSACGVGSCTGDTVIRVCETALGNNCDEARAMAVNDASGCGAGTCSGQDCCSQAMFTCPGTGTYTVWSAPYDSDDAATCTIAVAAP